MFEAFLLNKLLVIIEPFYAIFFTALIFAFMHTIYPGVRINFPLAFIGGFLFTQTYYFFPNIILASLMHICLNPVAVLHDFFVPSKTKMKKILYKNFKFRNFYYANKKDIVKLGFVLFFIISIFSILYYISF
jgi:membrane protease YdiL (CAAX protease family)